MTPRDDDALSWAGDSDPTLSAGGAPEDALPDGWTVPRRPGDGRGRAAVGGDAADSRTEADRDERTEDVSDDEAASPASSVALVGVGILAGIYLLYTIGWFIGVTRVGNPLVDPVARAMFTLGGWLAVAAPVVWFATTFWLTADRPRARFMWLLIGAILLAPLPLIIGVGGVS